MRTIRRAVLVAGNCIVALAGMALAETKVEVKKAHICCGACK